MTKEIYLFLSILICNNIFSQVDEKLCVGKLLCKVTNQAISYTNIGVVNQNLGTVSDQNGNFSLLIDSRFDENEIKFSSIGYVSKTMKVIDFKKQLQLTSIIFLEKAVSDLKEIVIKNKKLQNATLGNTLGRKTVSAGFVNNVLGNEIGIKIRINKKPTFIESFQAVVDYNKFANLKFRINIYNLKKGLPHENILIENIIVTSTIKSGLMIIDLSEYHIMVTHDFFISIELIEQLGAGGLRFLADYDGIPVITRAASQGKWNKQGSLSFGFSVLVKE
jgi:hypothetical protein